MVFSAVPGSNDHGARGEPRATAIVVDRLPGWVPWRTFTVDTSWSVRRTVAEFGRPRRPLFQFPRIRLAATRAKQVDNEYEFRWTVEVSRDSATVEGPSASAVVRVRVDEGPDGGARLRVSTRWDWCSEIFTAAVLTVTIGLGAAALAALVLVGLPAGLLLVLFLISSTLYRFLLCVGVPRLEAEARRAEDVLRSVFPPVRQPSESPYR
jgi:hypothetical protein